MHKNIWRTKSRIWGVLESTSPKERSAVAAVVRAIMKANKPIDIVPDTRYTVDGIHKSPDRTDTRRRL